MYNINIIYTTDRGAHATHLFRLYLDRQADEEGRTDRQREPIINSYVQASSSSLQLLAHMYLHVEGTAGSRLGS